MTLPNNRRFKSFMAKIPFSGSDSSTCRAIMEIKEGLSVYSDPEIVGITGNQVLPETIFANGFEVQAPE